MIKNFSEKMISQFYMLNLIQQNRADISMCFYFRFSQGFFLYPRTAKIRLVSWIKVSFGSSIVWVTKT